MLGEFSGWFGQLPPLLQGVGYLLLSPFALAGLGLVICIFDDTAIGAFEEHGPVLGFILLGAMAAGYLGSIFGVAMLFYKVVSLPYWLSVVVGLIFGLVVVPAVMIAVVNRKEKGQGPKR